MRTAPRWYRMLTLPLVAAVLATVGPYSMGAPISRAVIVGLTIGAVLLVFLRSIDAGPAAWPEDASEEALALGGQAPWTVPGLDDIRVHPESYPNRLGPRLHRDAVELLARRGIELESPEAARLLGERSHGLLTGRDPRPPSVRELSLLCATLAEIAADSGSGLEIPGQLRMGGKSRFLRETRIR